MPTRQSSAAVIKYARCHGESFGADAVALGAVHQELRDLMAIVKWAVVRGAMRVWLWLE